MAASTAAAKAAALGARAVPTTLDALLCGSVTALRHQLRPGGRLAALDVTPSHVTISVCDAARRTAAPFGILARTSSPRVDAQLLATAFARAAALHRKADVTDGSGDTGADAGTGTIDAAAFAIDAIVIGMQPQTARADATVQYARDLLDAGVSASAAAMTNSPTVTDATASASDNVNVNINVDGLFARLRACLLYSEAHALHRAVSAHRDYVDAVSKLPPGIESRRRSRFATAMDPKVDTDSLVDDGLVKARLSASDLLQAVLDDLARLDADVAPPTPRRSPIELDDGSIFKPWTPAQQ